MAKGSLEVSCNVPNTALLNSSSHRSVAYTVCGLQVFKFGCYVAIPIFMTAAFVTNPDRLAAIIKNVSQHPTVPLSGWRPFCRSNNTHMLVQRAYVVYPPESQRPPSYEELVELRNKSKRQ